MFSLLNLRCRINYIYYPLRVRTTKRNINGNGRIVGVDLLAVVIFREVGRKRIHAERVVVVNFLQFDYFLLFESRVGLRLNLDSAAFAQ